MTNILEFTVSGQDLLVRVPGFSLRDTLDCGQCFRWEPSEAGVFTGVYGGRMQTVSQEGESVRFHNLKKEEFLDTFLDYFDLDTDYTQLMKDFHLDPVLEKARGFAGGIRILRQEPWEALCSFIISQNNNIPRIKGIIARLCQTFGTPCPAAAPSGETLYSFPRPEVLRALTKEDLAPLRAGFRASYILDAAQKTASGEVDLYALQSLPIEDARKELLKIKGVGVKVAECALLFGFHRLEAFPIDTWIKKVLERYYPEGFPEYLKPCGGVAQQMLFHYIRHLPQDSIE